MLVLQNKQFQILSWLQQYKRNLGIDIWPAFSLYVYHLIILYYTCYMFKSFSFFQDSTQILLLSWKASLCSLQRPRAIFIDFCHDSEHILFSLQGQRTFQMLCLPRKGWGRMPCFINVAQEMAKCPTEHMHICMYVYRSSIYNTSETAKLSRT